MIAALFGLLFVPQILAELLPQTWKTTVGRYVPMEAGSQIFSCNIVKPAPSNRGPASVSSASTPPPRSIVGFLLISRRDA